MASGIKKRQYTDEEKSNALALLAANGGNVDRTAKELGIPNKTLDNWSRGLCGIHPAVAESGEQKKPPLAEAFRQVAYAALGKIDDEKMNQSTALELVKVAAIAVDKAQLLDGKPTEITQHDLGSIPDDQLDRFIADAERALRHAAGGEDAPPEGEAGPQDAQPNPVGGDAPARPPEDVQP